ncbi:MAG: hypothetical protein H6707_09760 [Deltaproteobacteria bacterium]|nr:hypothetical protein [Deltaproteobacteria bacterium]
MSRQLYIFLATVAIAVSSGCGTVDLGEGDSQGGTGKGEFTGWIRSTCDGLLANGRSAASACNGHDFERNKLLNCFSTELQSAYPGFSPSIGHRATGGGFVLHSGYLTAAETIDLGRGVGLVAGQRYGAMLAFDYGYSAGRLSVKPKGADVTLSDLLFAYEISCDNGKMLDLDYRSPRRCALLVRDSEPILPYCYNSSSPASIFDCYKAGISRSLPEIFGLSAEQLTVSNNETTLYVHAKNGTQLLKLVSQVDRQGRLVIDWDATEVLQHGVIESCKI